MILSRPLGVGLDQDGNVLVTDSATGSVCWFDVSRRSWARWNKAGPYTLVSPVAAARYRDTLFIVDSGLPALLALSTKGHYRFAVTNQLERPSGLAILGDKVYVADAGAHRILVFDPCGELLSQFGRRGVGPGEYNFPTHLATCGATNLLVTDSMNSRVQVVTPDGQTIGVIGSPGDGPGHFSRPKGVAADAFGHVYVADALFDNIQVFDLKGQLLMDFGHAGQEPGEFWLPGGVAVGPGNRIYVADTYNQRIQVFQYVGKE